VSLFVGFCRAASLGLRSRLVTISSMTSTASAAMTTNDPDIEQAFRENARLLSQTREICEQLKTLKANPVRQKLRELGVEDEQAFFSWLEKQFPPMDWSDAERKADESLTQLLNAPELPQPRTGNRLKSARQMV